MPCPVQIKYPDPQLWLFFAILGLSLFSNPASAQISNIDSLQSLLKRSTDDTNKVNMLNTIGKAFWQKGNYNGAVDYAVQARTLAEKLNFKMGISNASSILGLTYTEDAQYEDAYKNFSRALNLREAMGDRKGVAASYNNIGVVHIYEKKLDEALKDHQQALKIGQDLADKMTMATAYSNLGVVYTKQGRYEEALKCHIQAVNLRREMQREGRIEFDNYNIQTAFQEVPEYYQQHVAHKYTPSNNQETVVELYLNIAGILVKQKKYNEAKSYLDKALKEAEQTKDIQLILESYKSLAELASMGGEFQNAYEYYKKYAGLADSIRSKNDSSYAALVYYNCELEKAQIIQKKQEELNKARNTIKWITATSSGAFLVLLILFIITNYRLYLQKQKARRDLFMKNREN